MLKQKQNIGVKKVLVELKHEFSDNFEGAVSLFYPFICFVCDNDLPVGVKNVCPTCQSNFQRTYFEKMGEDNPAKKIFWGRIEVENVFCLLTYSEDNSTKIILNRIKYKKAQRLGVFMGELLGKLMKENHDYEDIEAVIPIPLHEKKEYIRGYNQSLTICNGVSNTTNLPVYDVLRRRRHHESQTTKNRFERSDNVKDIFDVKKGKKMPYQHIAIVDDVLTTGSTVESAYLALKHYFPEIKISVLTIAIAR